MLDIGPPEWPVDSTPPKSGTVEPPLLAVIGMALVRLRGYCTERFARLVMNIHFWRKAGRCQKDY